MSESYQLHWEGPFSLTSKGVNPLFWDVESSTKPGGLYTLAWPIGKDYHAHYIGMTQQNFIFRIEQHLQNYLSGKYYIYDTVALDNGTKKYIFELPSGFPSFISSYENICENLKTFFNKLAIFTAPCQVDRNELFILEAHLSKKVLDSGFGAILDSPKPNPNLLSHRLELQSNGPILPKGF